MKSSQNLISTVFKIPRLSHLSPSYECQRLKIFLPLTIKDALIGIFFKKDCLFFAFKNQIICNEFNKYHTKKILTDIQEHSALFPILLENLNLQSKNPIKGYVPKSHLHIQSTPPIQMPTYQERSFGIFQNYCAKDTTRHAILESIRAIILQNRHNDGDDDYIKL